MGRFDKVIVALLVIGTLVYISRFLSPGWQIYEDAAILFRYADHVSGGHGNDEVTERHDLTWHRDDVAQEPEHVV